MNAGSDSIIGALDSESLFEDLRRTPEFLRAVLDQAKADLAPRRERDITSVVACGLGTSAIAGEALRVLAAGTFTVPVIVVERPTLPRFVGPGTLVFVVSYSGETDETIEAARAAIATRAEVIAVTSGGSLRDIATEHGIPVIELPKDIGTAREALGPMTVALLGACARLGIGPDITDAVALAIEQVSRRIAMLDDSKTAFDRIIARSIGRSFPLILGYAGIGEVAARHFRSDINLNAKAPAYYGALPAFSHDELCGFGQSGDVTRQLLTLLFLRSDFEDPRASAEFALTEEFVAEAVANVLHFTAEGNGELAQLLDLLVAGDAVSLRLAANEGIDPGPVPVVDQMQLALRAPGVARTSA